MLDSSCIKNELLPSAKGSPIHFDTIILQRKMELREVRERTSQVVVGRDGKPLNCGSELRRDSIQRALHRSHPIGHYVKLIRHA